MFVIDTQDLNGSGNGDLVIRTDKGTLVALVYAHERSADYAGAIINALNAAFSPSHTDLMLSPEEINEWLEKNPPHDDASQIPPAHGRTAAGDAT